ncbi:MAG: hypothetical protein CR997_13105 [Acidobacteria bacterium]|nr:MAG: hypothetical protein CR997_13105 [Acidobacteriota bacterium]
MAQSDVLRLVGGSLEEGQSAQFPIYLQDVSGSGIDTGDQNIGAVSIKLTVPAGLITAASFQKAGVLESHPIFLEFDQTDLSQNLLLWYIAFGVEVPFTLDPADPGELIGYLNLTAAVNPPSSVLSFNPNADETFITDWSGGLSNTLANGKLTGDFQLINLVDPGGNPVPVINSFVANPAQISPGQTSELSWSVSGADTITIDQGVGNVSGSGTQNVSPASTTTYTLTAINSNGSSSAQVTITVSDPQAPVINSFTAVPSRIQKGDSSTLSWDVSGADSVSLSPGVGTVASSGFREVNPDATTIYTLSATNQAGTVHSEVTVTVTQGNLPSIDLFSANPASIQKGESSVLQWNVQGADDISIVSSLGSSFQSLAQTGSVTVSPNATDQFTLTAANTAGSVQQSVTITVEVPQGVPSIVSFASNPEEPESGTVYELSWHVEEGDAETALTLETHDGSWNLTELIGSRTFLADESRSYTLTATNEFGSDQKTIHVLVQGLFDIVTFDVKPEILFKGQQATITWLVTNADNVLINPGIGSVEASGQTTVTVNETTVYELVANREGEVKKAVAEVQVYDFEEGEFTYFPLIKDDSEWETEVGLVNLSPVQVKFTVYRFDQEGTLAEYFTNQKLAPFESKTYTFNNMKEPESWLQVWNKMDNIGSVGLFGWANVKTKRGNQLAAYSAPRVTVDSLLVPHLAKDTNFYTVGAVVSGINGGQAAFHSSGISYPVGNLAEKQAATWDFRELMAGDLEQSNGWGTVSGESAMEQRITGLEFFGRTPQTGLSQIVGVTLDDQTAEELVFAHIAKDVNQFWTGCVVINPQEEDVTLDILVFNDEGEMLEGGPASEVLAAGAKKTVLVDRYHNGLAEGTSWAIFKASQPVFGYMLFGSYSPDDRFSGFQSVKAPSQTLCFPDTAMSTEEGGWTGLALVNNNSSENQVRLVLMNEKGEEKGEVILTLAPMKKFIGLVKTVFQGQTLEKGDKVMAFAASPIAGFELYGKNKETLGGILAFPWNF